MLSKDDGSRLRREETSKSSDQMKLSFFQEKVEEGGRVYGRDSPKERVQRGQGLKSWRWSGGRRSHRERGNHFEVGRVERIARNEGNGKRLGGIEEKLVT